MAITYTQRWTVPSKKPAEDSQPQEVDADGDIASISTKDLDPATMAFYWITPTGDFVNASNDIINVDSSESHNDARNLTIKHCLDRTPAVNSVISEDYDIIDGKLLSKSLRTTVLPEDIVLGVDSDVITLPVGEYMQTVFKECGKDVKWFTPWSGAVVRSIEVKCGRIWSSSSRTTASPSAHAGFIFGNKEGLEKVIAAIESIKQLRVAHPTTESLKETEQQVTLPNWTLGPALPVKKDTIACLQPANQPVITVIIPTENKHKIAMIQKYFSKRVPVSHVMHFDIVPVQSDVNEQPYNTAGTRGAWNRIRNAVEFVTRSEELEARYSRRQAKNIYVAAIENFVQTKDIERPADFGVVVLYNVLEGTCAGALSTGVTINPVLVEAAQRYGCDAQDEDCGMVTVGSVLASRFPGVDKANWHELVAGVSRYDLLTEALESLELP